jgi:hypothetical protein
VIMQSNLLLDAAEALSEAVDTLDHRLSICPTLLYTEKEEIRRQVRKELSKLRSHYNEMTEQIQRIDDLRKQIVEKNTNG